MLHLIRWIALHMGRGTARSLLYPITLYFLLTAGKQRRASREFLNMALNRPATPWDVTKHIHTFASTILDRVFMMTDRYDCFDLKINNHELIAEVLNQNRGCILLGSHLGSFEVLRITAVLRRELPLKILMYPQHNEMLVRILSELNPTLSDNIIPLGQTDTLIRAQESAASGSIIGMLGDRVADSGKTVTCRFFDRPANFSQGPILLASLLKVPVFLFFGVYLGGNRYEIHIESFADQISLTRGSREQDIQYWTQRYAERLEHYARSAPYNWFNFYDYWDVQQTGVEIGSQNSVPG
ncbi:MAG: lipid A biosynthesis acyltransferase [Candidatus Thiodiazotropha sp. (ex Monitilora ramsayi)]|nr:lipid A biosynthesis acyltransferase [Candidatus Thiodiazotropha sp. (ex Monitilora ramsayi)]